ncbi:hypothetical protein BT96DRAFT_915075 [Gymnopus androsaceus JB14]|uniref:C2H2-type domain-containing protein n=1 Tax=Gymnopus androsaceus JB14 TaxID=1447944 RepID=A0A6A4ICS7_9AGAR|nr:hypothetical protein BT96DRAFT_915075 [Gymnopus androsaceus JB14]
MPRAKTLKDGRPNQANMAATCPACGAVVSNRTDLPRHMRIHSNDKQKFMHRCPYPNCNFENLQRSNVETHIRTHTKNKTNNCPDCDFITADPGSLTRHRKRLHAYVPQMRRSRHPKPKNASSDESQTQIDEGFRPMQMGHDFVSAETRPRQTLPPITLPPISVAIPEYYSTRVSPGPGPSHNHLITPYESAPMTFRRVSQARLERDPRNASGSAGELAF